DILEKEIKTYQLNFIHQMLKQNNIFISENLKINEQLDNNNDNKSYNNKENVSSQKSTVRFRRAQSDATRPIPVHSLNKFEYLQNGTLLINKEKNYHYNENKNTSNKEKESSIDNKNELISKYPVGFVYD